MDHTVLSAIHIRRERGEIGGGGAEEEEEEEQQQQRQQQQEDRLSLVS